MAGLRLNHTISVGALLTVISGLVGGSWVLASLQEKIDALQETEITHERGLTRLIVLEERVKNLTATVNRLDKNVFGQPATPAWVERLYENNGSWP